jgi:hypothetical protein
MYWDGKRGEHIFEERMRYNQYGVKDVRKVPEYWNIDIDYILTSPFTGAVKNFEVKWDSKIHTTGNLYLELENIFSKQWNGEGWWLHCEADYLAYGDAQTSKFYVIPMKELRERVESLPTRIAHCANESTGLLVSLKDIEDLYKTI